MVFPNLGGYGKEEIRVRGNRCRGDRSSRRCHGQPLRSFLKWYCLREERTRTQAQYYHYHHHPHLLTPSLHFLILLQFGFFSDFKDKEGDTERVRFGFITRRYDTV